MQCIMIFSFHVNRIPVQKLSVLRMLAVTQTLNMTHTHVYVCPDSLETTVKVAIQEIIRLS